MTKEELCIYACKYAIGELTRKGSTAFITSAHEGRQQITWVEVMEWLNREQKSEDAISRQAALDIYDDYNVAVENGELEAYRKHRERLLKLSSVQPKIKTGHWIPVSERLPEKTGWYLVTFNVCDNKKAVCELSYRKPENYWTDKNISRKILDNSEVLAWMPLPEPYKPQESEKS